jgi:predicted transposase YbfD/YdcC
VNKQTQSQETWRKNTTEAELANGHEGIVFDVGSLGEHFSRLVDSRKARGKRYSLVTILVLMTLAKLCGHDRPEAMADWARQRCAAMAEMLRLKRKAMPHATTYGRLLHHVIPLEDYEREMNAYFAQQATVREARQYCIDGKQIRGTAFVTGEGNVYLLGVYVPGAGVMLMQAELAPGEGELSVAPRVLKTLDLQGKVVTGDAAFTQRNLSLQIVNAGGDYVWKVKANQPKLLEEIKLLFKPPAPALPGFSTPPMDFRACSQTTCGHGRVEKRTLTASSLLQGHSDWPHLAQVFMLECQTTYKKTGQITYAVTYGVTSQCAAQASPHLLLQQTRNHWAIEGGSHQRRDVTFHEDGCDLRRGNSAHIMAILNNIAIALISRAGFDNAAHARRLFDAKPSDALPLLTRA